MGMIQGGSSWVEILNLWYSQDNIKSVFKTESLESATKASNFVF